MKSEPWRLGVRFGLARGGYTRRSPATTAQSAPAGGDNLPGLSVVLVSHNEAHVLARTLPTLRELADEIVIVDAESSDDTAKVAARYADRVVSISNTLMVDAHKNVGIEAARHRWILILDPDELVTPQLGEEIRRVVTDESPQYDAYGMPRRSYELGRWIRAMGHYPGMQLRLVRQGAGHYGGEVLHTQLEGPRRVGRLNGDLIHLPSQRVFDYAAKRNRYSEFEAQRLHAAGYQFRARRLLSAPLSHFIREFVLLGGWLEGITGFVMSANGAWESFLVQAKLWELASEQR